MLCECSFTPLGSCRSFLNLLFPFINQYLIHLCNGKSRRLFFVKDSFDFFFDYGRRNFLSLQFELIESFMDGYFDLSYASIDFRGRYTIRIKIIPFDSLRFRIPFGWLKSIADIVPYSFTTKSDVGVNL